MDCTKVKVKRHYQIGKVTVKDHYIDEVLEVLEKAGFLIVKDESGLTETTFIIAKAQEEH